MRITNTTNSIANAICRFRVKGLSVLSISPSLHLPLWRLLTTCVGQMRNQSCLQSGSNSALAKWFRQLTRLAAQILGNMDADICRYLDRLSGKRLAMAVRVPAPVEARLASQERTFFGDPSVRFRNPV